MASSYAVIWREEDLYYAGVLEFELHGFRLEGTARSEPRTMHELRCSKIVGTRVGRSSADRIDGRPAVIVDLPDGGRLSIASAAGVGFGHEIAERLRRLTQDALKP
jgi:hypothetical protein